MNNEDRRVVRTRRLLKQALLDLLEVQTYEETTIRDITDRADIGYATFFRHYDGKDELMLQIFTGIIAELESVPDRHGDRYFEQEGVLLFQHVAENRSLYRSILETYTFARKFREHVKEMVQGHLDDHADQIASPAIPFEVAAHHMVAALLGLIDWWISNEMPYSIERMAGIYERLIVQATWHALQAGNPMVLPWDAGAQKASAG